MRKFWKKYRVVIIVLAVVAVMVAAGLMRKATDPHAGHDHTNNPHTEQNQNADPHAGHDHSNYKVEQSYTVNTDQNGRYTVQVKDAHGQVIYSRQNLPNKPTCTKVNDSVLLVSDSTNPSLDSHWSIFCNVKTGRVSDIFSGCLATKGTCVAYVTNLTDAWQVRVRDAFDEQVYAQFHTLEGAAAPNGHQVIQKAELNKDGDLSVTYLAGQQEKTVVIPLPQA